MQKKQLKKCGRQEEIERRGQDRSDIPKRLAFLHRNSKQLAPTYKSFPSTPQIKFPETNALKSENIF